MTMTQLLNFARCTHVLYRLSLTDDPAWDRKAIYSTIDLLDTMRRAADKMLLVPSALGFDDAGDDMFTRSSANLKATIPIWGRAMSQAGAIEVGFPTDEASASEVAIPAAVGSGFDESILQDFSDDAWMTDMFNSWDTY